MGTPVHLEGPIIVVFIDDKDVVAELVKVKPDAKTGAYETKLAITMQERTKGYQIVFQHNENDSVVFQPPNKSQFSYPGTPHITMQFKSQISGLPVSLTFGVDGWYKDSHIQLIGITIRPKSE